MELYHVYLQDTGKTLSVTDSLDKAIDCYLSKLYSTIDVWYKGSVVGSFTRGRYTKTQVAKEFAISTQLEQHIGKKLLG